MGMREVFENELGISNHLTLLRKFNCEECGRLISRGERYWEINHYETPSAFDDGHMHVLCTTCAPRIENAEAIYITYYAKFFECDCHRIHIRMIGRMEERIPRPQNPNVQSGKLNIKGLMTPNMQESMTKAKLDFEKKVAEGMSKNCPDCGKPMVLKNGTYSCFDCDTHINSDCASLDEFCNNLDIESFAPSNPNL